MRKRNKKTGRFMKTLKDKKCQQCNKSFTPKNNKTKFCSKQCYFESKKGQISKLRNGKNIKCKYCKKEFYISKSRFKTKKYCSNECAKLDNYGFKPKKKKCIICGKEFTITNQLQTQKKTCSYECWKENNKNIAKKNKLKNRIVKEKKDWNSYKDGKSSSRGLHSRACYNYRKKFLEKHGYMFCEHCGTNINGTMRFETHHIYFASRYPKHPELHNDKNLIVLCTSCHHKFHGVKSKELMEIYEEKRGLKELFKGKSKLT